MNAIVSRHLLTPLQVGRSYTDRFSISPEDMAGFAALSGDRSLVHGTCDFARRLGLEGRVVYEGLLVIRLTRLIGINMPSLANGLWGGLRMDFHHPLYVGEDATLTLAIDDLLPTSCMARLSFRVKTGCSEGEGRLVAEGGLDTLVCDGF